MGDAEPGHALALHRHATVQPRVAGGTTRAAPVVGRSFMSCLCGSEPQCRNTDPATPFLSCLFGSERAALAEIDRREFLSCLFGSELFIGVRCALYSFLSCLFGSELEPETGN